MKDILQQTNINQEVNTNESGEHLNIALALLCIAQFMIVLDAFIVTIALPSIGRTLALTQTGLSWVLNIYLLTFGGFLLLGGRLGDYFGRRRVLVIGLMLFTVASLVGGLAQSGWMLIGARAIQGMAAAAVAPSVLSLITTTFAEGSERNWALGIYGAVSASGFTVGTLLGGILIQFLNWRWVFFVNVPLGIIATLLVPMLLQESYRRTAQGFDFPGALSITAGLMALVFGLTEAEHLGWISWPILSALLGGILLILLFIFVEYRSQAPLVRLDIFRQRMLTGGNLVGIFDGLTNAPLIFILTLYMQNILGYSAIETALAFLPFGLVIVLASQGVSRLVDLLGVRWCLVGSTIVMAGGYAILAEGISVSGSYFSVLLPGMILVGVGVAFMIVAGSIAATTGVSNNEQGLASGLFNTSQRIGGSLGIAIFVAVSATRRSALGGSVAARVEGFRLELFFGFTLLACLTMFFIIPQKHREPK